jgi:hypothetical protein
MANPSIKEWGIRNLPAIAVSYAAVVKGRTPPANIVETYVNIARERGKM